MSTYPARPMPPPQPLYPRLGKRLLDLVVTVLALLALAPLLLIIAGLVRLSSPGPVLFRQERLGHDRRPFTLLKFRTMYTGCDDAAHRAYVTRLLTGEAPELGAGRRGLFKLPDDPRITPIGVWLRRTSLDELPQLFNVLAGRMSLVGPRPCLAWESELYDPRDLGRFRVPPGLTGLWQVSGRNRLSARQALDLDLTYVERQGLWLDLVIMARTLPALLRSEAS